jgi:hypothetical protein
LVLGIKRQVFGYAASQIWENSCPEKFLDWRLGLDI